MAATDELKAQIVPILGDAPLRLAMLFGSAATGRLRPDSDVDVGIVPVDPEWPLAAELELASALSRAVGREVDLVRLDRADALVRWQVARVGIALVSRPSFEAPRFVAIAASEHADTARSVDLALATYRRFLQRTAS